MRYVRCNAYGPLASTYLEISPSTTSSKAIFSSINLISEALVVLAVFVFRGFLFSPRLTLPVLRRPLCLMVPNSKFANRRISFRGLTSRSLRVDGSPMASVFVRFFFFAFSLKYARSHTNNCKCLTL